MNVRASTDTIGMLWDLWVLRASSALQVVRLSCFEESARTNPLRFSTRCRLWRRGHLINRHGAVKTPSRPPIAASPNRGDEFRHRLTNRSFSTPVSVRRVFYQLSARRALIPSIVHPPRLNLNGRARKAGGSTFDAENRRIWQYLWKGILSVLFH